VGNANTKKCVKAAGHALFMRLETTWQKNHIAYTNQKLQKLDNYVRSKDLVRKI